MVAATKFECFSENLAEKAHNLDSDTLNIYLSAAAPNAATHTVKADIAEVATGNGYAGPVDTQNATSRSGGTTTVTATDITITASGGSITAFRYVVLYNDTSTGDMLIQWWDYGSNLTLLDTEAFTIDFGSNSLMTIA